MYIHVLMCSYKSHACMYMYIHIIWSAWQANSKIQLVVCASTSIFSSPPESSLLWILRLPYLYQMDLIPLQSRWTSFPSKVSLPDGPHSPPKWLEYVYRTAHPVLRWLPTKLAEWIGENLQDELGFPDKADQRGQPVSGWTPAELNHVLQSHVVDGALTTFGCVEWESELCRGVIRARCYPCDMPKHSFHGMNPKVLYIHCANKYIHVISNMYITCMYMVYTLFI